MQHEVLALLLDPAVFTKFACVDCRYLFAGNRQLAVLYSLIQKLQQRQQQQTGGQPGCLSVDELQLAVEASLRPGAAGEEERSIFRPILDKIREVERSKYSDAALQQVFERVSKRSIAMDLAAAALPVLNSDGDLDLTELIGCLEAHHTRLQSLNGHHIEDRTIFYGEEVGEEEAQSEHVVPSYLPKLDGYLEGGLSGGHLATIVGGTGIGKTLLLHQSAATAMYHGKRAGLVTLEISPRECRRRMDRLFGGRSTPEYGQRLATARDRGGQLSIVDGSQESVTPETIRALLESWKRKGRPADVLYIDYADLMETGRNLEDYDEQGLIYRDLRRLAARFGLPIWTASQAIRSALDAEWVGLHHVADSFKKVRVADLVLTLSQTPREQRMGALRLAVAKSRRGAGHPVINLRTDLERMRVVPI